MIPSTKRCLLVALLGLVISGAPGREAAGEESKASELSQKVLEAAKALRNQKVGRGECVDLAEAALQAAGAKTTGDYGVKGPGKDYIWGQLVEGADKNYSLIQPGDVIQWRDVKVIDFITVNGQKAKRTRTVNHHTSIVSANLGKGKIKVLEQNVAGVKEVKENDFDLNNRQGGTIWFYRPEKK